MIRRRPARRALLSLCFAALAFAAACSERSDGSDGRRGDDSARGAGGEAAKRAGELPEGGVLSPGRYSTGESFEPPFTFEVGRGWRVLPAPGPYSLTLGYVAPGNAVAEGKAIRFLDVQKVFEPGGERAGEPSFEAKPAPEELVPWLRRHPYLTTGEPETVEIGGVSGERLDATAEVPRGYSDDHGGGCPLPCLPLFRLGDGSVSHITEKSEDRFAVLQDVRGERIVVVVSAPADAFDEFSPEATEVLDSVRWGA